MSDILRIKRSLISVSDKSGIVSFAKDLANENIDIISTGNTFKELKKNKINVKNIEEITSFPEILSGRVKTLHPKIFGGILADFEGFLADVWLFFFGGLLVDFWRIFDGFLADFWRIFGGFPGFPPRAIRGRGL